MPLRREEEMLRGGPPVGPQGPPAGPPAGPPGMAGAPPGMPPEPGMVPPGMMMEPDMAPPEEEMGLPGSAVVMEVAEGSVIVQDDTGQMRKVPLEAFPIPPTEGMPLVQAVVVEAGDGFIIAQAETVGERVEIPTDALMMEFNVGDYFWLPEPPADPEQLSPEPPGMF